MRASVLERLVLESWSGPLRPSAVAGLADAVATAGADLPEATLTTIVRLGAWVRAFEDFAGDRGVPEDEVARCVERYAQLEPARDPLSDVFRLIHDALRDAPLGAAFEALWANQLGSALHSIASERRGGGARPARYKQDPLETYLERAADGVSIALEITAAAMMIGERGALTSIASLAAAERHASIALRLANDIAFDATTTRIWTARSFATEPQLRARIAAERGAFEAALAALETTAPRTARFARRFTDGLLAASARGERDVIAA